MGGKLLSALSGVAWSLATLFVVPILVIENCGPISAVRRSTEVIRKRWGEGVSGSLTILSWSVVVAVPAALLLGAGGALVDLHRAIGLALIVAGALLLVGLVAIGGAVQQVFAVALYRYATQDSVNEFPEQDLGHPFTRRRGFLSLR